MDKLKSIFAKKVDRSIEGVIKADDEASLGLELDEYVLTNEVEKRLEYFLNAYNNYSGANGVWISGFFGSGKSHLLKMLALLLENREVQFEGATKTALDLFLPKCDHNVILREELRKAVDMPSQSILFNIDQKADVISKTQFDALLAVFVKVFDEMCGYYGKQGHIAQFERDLDSRELYEGFKQAYSEIAGKSWERGREQALLEGGNIAKAYSQVTGEDESLAKNILDKYRSEYRLSIEDFAEQVNDYIEKQIKDNDLKDFRLNFFVDEVGQYIADNVKLMTNLQTVSESLATKCQGRAWIIVTAQEDMDTVVGETGRQQGNDFSKIQDRFKNRMKLTSKDVAEVIQKRLLVKNEAGQSVLSKVYDKEANNFKTLFSFSEGTQKYQNFKDKEHFVDSYPFIPYQFPLFQAAITNLSQHNAFEGKSSSVGERSMLGVFQQVAIKISDNQIGKLATFDLMFEGVRHTLKSNIQRAIINAENHLDNEFAVQVLKALFLVKYIKEFQPTLHNLCVLMLDSFDKDISELRREVEEALNLLESQTYIRRTGELYEYLTDEEKDIEEEIKATDVDRSAVAEELSKIIFGYAIKDTKIRYVSDKSGSSGQDYAYANKLDDELHSRPQELSINVISPFHENSENFENLIASSTFSSDDLYVVLPSDARVMKEILMYKQTDKYIKQNYSSTQQQSVQRILTEKGQQNNERRAELQKRVANLVGQARLLVAGKEVTSKSSDPQSRINEGFNELITRAYPYLQMLNGVSYSEADVAKIIDATQSDLLSEGANLSEPENEILIKIKGNKNEGTRSTVKSIVDLFEKKPYGWHHTAILCTLAKLYVHGKVEVRLDGNLLEDKKLASALVNTKNQINLVLEPQIEFTSSQVRNLKDFYQDFFDKPPSNHEAKALATETIDGIQEKIAGLERHLSESQRYPFIAALNPAVKLLKQISKHSYDWYLTELTRGTGDELLDIKEATIDPLIRFINGPQKEIYDEAKVYLARQDSNFSYLKGAEHSVLSRLLEDEDIYKGGRIQKAKTLLDNLKQSVDAARSQAVDESIESIKALQSRMQESDEYKSLPDIRQQEFDEPYTKVIEDIKEQHLIAVIKERERIFTQQAHPRNLSRLIELVNKPKKVETTHEDVQPVAHENISTDNKQSADADYASEESKEVSEPVVEYVTASEVSVDYSRAWLDNENDVDEYLQAMREALLKQIKDGKKVYV